MAEKTKRPTMGELLLEYFTNEFSFVSVKLTNGDGSNPQQPDEVIGLPVTYDEAAGTATLDLAASEGNLNALVVDGPELEQLAAGGTSENEYKVLVRGPAVVRKSKIIYEDLSGAALTEATIDASLLSERILVRAQEGLSETQTT